MLDIQPLLDDLEFAHDLEFPGYLDAGDPADVARFLDDNIELEKAPEWVAVSEALKAHDATETKLTNEQLREVFVKLKERELHPRGEFDKAGRFYLADSELVDCRAPSAKYPYSQMQAGRTAKYVKRMNEKYRPQTIEAFLTRFKAGGGFGNG